MFLNILSSLLAEIFLNKKKEKTPPGQNTKFSSSCSCSKFVFPRSTALWDSFPLSLFIKTYWATSVLLVLDRPLTRNLNLKFKSLDHVSTTTLSVDLLAHEIFSRSYPSLLCDLTTFNDNKFPKENRRFGIRGVNWTLLVSSINKSFLLYETTQLRNLYHVSTEFSFYCHFPSQSLTTEISLYSLGNYRLHSLILCHR